MTKDETSVSTHDEEKEEVKESEQSNNTKRFEEWCLENDIKSEFHIQQYSEFGRGVAALKDIKVLIPPIPFSLSSSPIYHHNLSLALLSFSFLLVQLPTPLSHYPILFLFRKMIS
jgi:hypothetical protein